MNINWSLEFYKMREQVLFQMEIWHVNRVPLVESHLLAKNINCSPLLAELLINRGIKEPSKAKIFLEEGGLFCSPLELSDMKTAVDRISTAVKNREKIVIYGDYDVDGITATCILMDLLKRSGANVDFYLPERLVEGYGLNLEAIQFLKKNGADLIITVDCGITSIEIARQARDLGLDLIITDHHTPLDILPEAIAVVNPHLNNYKTPLCGAGVALKLSQALAQAEPYYFKLSPLQIQLAAFGTVADIVDLVDENRRIVKLGLESMNKEPIPGIIALKEVAGLLEKEIDSSRIAFVLAPRVNASGRLDSAQRGVHLFLSETVLEALPIAEEMNRLNVARREIEEGILQVALEQAESQLDNKALVLAGENWHSGVIGIVASRIVERHYRPTVVIELNGDECHGSCRSIDNFNIYKALDSTKDYLLKFGGHPMAAGLSIKRDMLNEFSEAFFHYANSTLTKADLYPRIYIDTAINSPITIPLIEELMLLEPCGAANPAPILAIKDANLESVYPVGNEKKHLRLRVNQNGNSYGAIAFNMAHLEDSIKDQENLDLVFTPEINEYIGQRSVSLNIKKMRPKEKLWECFGEEKIWQFWSTLEHGELSNIGKQYLEGKKKIELPSLGLISNMKALQSRLFLDNQVEFSKTNREIDSIVRKPKIINKKEIGLLIDCDTVLMAFLAEGATECTLAYLPSNYWWWRLFWEVAQRSETISLKFNPSEFQEILREHRLNHPDDEDLRRIFVFLSRIAKNRVFHGTYRQTALDMENRFGRPFTEATIKKAFQIFTEMGLMEYIGFNQDGVRYLIHKPKHKLDLMSSLSYNEGIFIGEELKIYKNEISLYS